MEVRFVVLLPDNPGKILTATSLVRGLKAQVGDSYVYVMLRRSSEWLIRGNSSMDEVLSWQDKPDELAGLVRNLLPDYLIDLDEGNLYRRFKRRTRLLCFTSGQDRKENPAPYGERIFKTVRFFDVTDDGKGPDFQFPAYNPDWLPEKFLGGYVVLVLYERSLKADMPEERLVELVSLIEKPLVVAGPAGERPLADRIAQKTGCSAFPVCGDFPEPETASLIGASNAVMCFGQGWAGLALVLNKPVLRIGKPGTGQDECGEIRVIDPTTGNLQEAALYVRKWFNTVP